MLDLHFQLALEVMGRLLHLGHFRSLCLLSALNKVRVFVLQALLLGIDVLDLPLQLSELGLESRHEIVLVVVVRLLQTFFVFFRAGELTFYTSVFLSDLFVFHNKLVKLVVFAF